MKYYKLDIELMPTPVIIPSPLDPDVDIGGIELVEKCDYCGDSDEIKKGPYELTFRKKPWKDIFSCFRPEILINEKVRRLLIDQNITGIELEEIIIINRNEISFFDKIYQVNVISEQGKIDYKKTKHKKNIDFCKKCGANSEPMIEEETIIYYDSMPDNDIFFFEDQEAFLIVSENVKKIFEENDITGIDSYMECLKN